MAKPGQNAVNKAILRWSLLFVASAVFIYLPQTLTFAGYGWWGISKLLFRAKHGTFEIGNKGFL